MLRPQSARRPWTTPELARAHAGEDSNYLRDDVAAMFRDSFDEDGLDLLKRGPRSVQERLAYAQLVRPDAHVTAEPAPADVQRRFVQQGVLDQARYFVGPDRVVHQRREDSAELGAAATRRGFETAIGGFVPTSLEGALAELSDVGTTPGTPNGIGDMGYLSVHRPVPPDVRLTESAEQAIDEIEQRARPIESDRRGRLHLPARR